MPLSQRTIRLGVLPGKDVEAWMRAVHRVLGVGSLTTFASKPTVWRRSFGPLKKRQVAAAQRKLAMEVSGMIGPATQSVLTPYLDGYARALLEPGKPKLVEPWQGWDSLHRSLWPAYSLGRNLRLGDGSGQSSGTYNPASRLPSGARSDHAYNPAWAFDLDTDPDGPAGWDSPVAQKFFHEMIGRPEVSYVICGPWIWSRDRGLRAYLYGGHFNHIHVSGRRK